MIACLLSAFVATGVSAWAADPSIKVAVGNYPLKYFVQRLAGDRADIYFPVPKDEDPAFWQPKDDEIAGFQQSTLILMNGATYSKWADKVTLPRAKVIDTSAAFKDQFITIASATTHSHGAAGMHSHAGTAFTTWIDFHQAATQTQAVHDALLKKLPDAKDVLDANLASLRADIEALDARMLAAGKKIGARPLVASHPVYHYLARRYGLNIREVLWEPEEVPTDAQMQDLQKLLAGHPAKVMIWEGAPAAASVEKLKTIGLSGLVFDPCGNSPDAGDWLTMMQANVTAIETLAR